VLGALFHEGAIICEADADRVFYSEINERLLAARAGGADGCLFLNAQNKQTIRRIVRPLREMGIPAVAVTDLDILKGREDFRDLLKATFVPQVFWEPWEEIRARIFQKMKGEDWKAGGIYRAARELRGMAEQLLAGCAEYGLFIVPTGELECWLPELEVGGHGPEWLTAVFLRPAEGGVWRFVQHVARWIADPRRKGMRDEVIPLDHLLAPPDEDSIAKPPEENGDRRREGNPEGGRRQAKAAPSSDRETNGRARSNGKKEPQPARHDQGPARERTDDAVTVAPLQAHASSESDVIVEPRAA
jgi:hypothetical protein